MFRFFAYQGILSRNKKSICNRKMISLDCWNHDSAFVIHSFNQKTIFDWERFCVFLRNFLSKESQGFIALRMCSRVRQIFRLWSLNVGKLLKLDLNLKKKSKVLLKCGIKSRLDYPKWKHPSTYFPSITQSQ